jgi:hypothetical protein
MHRRQRAGVVSAISMGVAVKEARRGSLVRVKEQTPPALVYSHALHFYRQGNWEQARRLLYTICDEAPDFWEGKMRLVSTDTRIFLSFVVSVVCWAPTLSHACQ